MNRYMQDVDENVRRIDRLVSSLSDEALRTPNDSLADTSVEVVDSVNHADTRRINRRSLRNVIPSDFVDLCTPPRHNILDNESETNSLQSSPDPDVQIIGIQYLPRRLFVGRRLYDDDDENYNIFDGNEVFEIGANMVDSYNYVDDDDDENLDLREIPFTQSMVELSVASEQKQSPIGVDSSYKCPICLECVKSRSPVATKCGHVFCNVCIIRAINLNMRPQCPLCKTNISSRELLRIFL